MSKRLTDINYWENYYSDNKVNRSQINSICSIYDKYWEDLIHENESSPVKTIIEIGGHPGRYLAYLAEKYSLVPTCLDFNSDRSKIDQSMRSMGVSDYNIIQADFLNYETKEKYDIVISNGFIEHFENYDEVLDKHINYLNSGGTMLIMIPNMTGYIKFYKKLVDKGNLAIHNLECMNKKVFKNFAKRNNLTIHNLSFFGGFPFSVHQELNYFQSIFFQIHRQICKKGLDNIIKSFPSSFYSSGLVAVFKLNS
jgi:cyclopropane fatty-acyl-phospholipid synthase-like methyltransferase